MTDQQPPFAAMVPESPKAPRASTEKDKVLRWVQRVARSVAEIPHSRHWPSRCDADTLYARLWLIRETLVHLTAKAPREFGLAFPGPAAQQMHTLLLEVAGAIHERTMTQDGETRYWGEWNASAGVTVLDRLREFAEKQEAAAPDFLETFAPIQDATVGVDGALGVVARTLLSYLPHSAESFDTNGAEGN
jgi:hypothetical protein